MRSANGRLAGDGADPPHSRSQAPPALPDHILEEILVRIRAPADLVRATAACETFRRLINDPTFLRRYRSLHPPLLLGLVDDYDFLPAEAPHSNAPAARALAAAFSLDHLPYRALSNWLPCDARNGRFLVMNVMCSFDPNSLDDALPELAVCDPVTREYTLLPTAPDGLVASTLVQIQDENIEFLYPFFDRSGCHEEAQFRVVCWTRSEEMAAIFVYSSSSGSWTYGTSVGFAALGLDVQPDVIPCNRLLGQLCVWLLLLACWR